MRDMQHLRKCCISFILGKDCNNVDRNQLRRASYLVSVVRRVRLIRHAKTHTTIKWQTLGLYLSLSSIISATIWNPSSTAVAKWLDSSRPYNMNGCISLATYRGVRMNLLKVAYKAKEAVRNKPLTAKKLITPLNNMSRA